MLEVNISKALHGFNLEVAFSVDQEILGIVGPSGSGKTMTLQCIAGLVRPDHGYIKLKGRALFDRAANVNLTTQKRKVGFVFQNYALFPYLSAYDNIAFGIPYISSERKTIIINDLIDKMELRGLSQRYPRQLSAGQQQRVALARALAPGPDVLLLDEPFSALDTPTRERLELGILKLKQFYKGSILFVTHDVDEAYRLSSRIAIYEAGGIAQCDEKAKVIASPANLMVARLTGFRNLMEGTITEVRDSSMWIDVPAVGTLRALRHDDSCLTPGMDVIVGIRSEHVQISEQGGENTVQGDVQHMVEEITSSRYVIHATGNGTYRSDIEVILPKSHSRNSFSHGAELRCYFPPERLMVIEHKNL